MKPANIQNHKQGKNCNSCESKGKCPLENMKIALVGGLDRLEHRYREAFESLGAEMSFHPGKCAGSGAAKLRTAACNADIVVFITSINSHNALQVVKLMCKKSGKRFIVMRETGPDRVSRGIAEKIGA